MSDRTREISIALASHLDSMPNRPRVDWENYGDGVDKGSFEPVSGSPYLAEYLLPASTDRVTNSFNEEPVYSGVYQVSVFTPAGAGRNQAGSIAVNVSDWFKPGTTVSHGTTGFKILEFADIANFEGPSNGWFKADVRISYQVVL